MSSNHADNRTIADHNRLDALRRLAKDRAATPAEKATARRFAKALAAKIGKRPRRSRRKGPGAALPEPPAATSVGRSARSGAPQDDDGRRLSVEMRTDAATPRNR